MTDPVGPTTKLVVYCGEKGVGDYYFTDHAGRVFRSLCESHDLSPQPVDYHGNYVGTPFDDVSFVGLRDNPDWSGARLVCAPRNERVPGFPWRAMAGRGSLVPWRDGWAVATFDPGVVVGGKDKRRFKAQDELKVLLSQDIWRALNCLEPKIPAVNVVSGRRLREAWEEAGRPKVVGCDIEGQDGKVVLIGFSWSEHEAWVCWWDGEVKDASAAILAESIPVFHNAAFDIPELEEVGVPAPEQWYDTINTGFLVCPFSPDAKAMNLQSQVLTWVPGSVAWKGLVNHGNPRKELKEQRDKREFWSDLLRRLDRNPPSDWREWYAFYNGLDVAWGLGLVKFHKQELGPRWKRYLDIEQPLQKVLLGMSQRGLPISVVALKANRRGVEEETEEALIAVSTAARPMLQEQLQDAVSAFRAVEKECNEAVLLDDKMKAKLKAAREARRAAERRFSDGFNPNSAKQLRELLFGWFALPVKRTTDGGEPTTDEKMLRSLLNSLEKKRIKPKRGEREEAADVLRSLLRLRDVAYRERMFLRPTLKENLDG